MMSISVTSFACIMRFVFFTSLSPLPTARINVTAIYTKRQSRSSLIKSGLNLPLLSSSGHAKLRKYAHIPYRICAGLYFQYYRPIYSRGIFLAVRKRKIVKLNRSANTVLIICHFHSVLCQRSVRN